MNQQVPHATRELVAVFERQKLAFATTDAPSLAARKASLKQLKKQLARYQDAFADAISADFGGRSHDETRMLDVLKVARGISHALSGLHRWMKPVRSCRWAKTYPCRCPTCPQRSC